MNKVRFLVSLKFQIITAISLLVITAVVLLGLLVTYLSKASIEEERMHLGMTGALIVKSALKNPTTAERAAGEEGLIQQASRISRYHFDTRYLSSISFFNTKHSVVYSTLSKNKWPYAKVFDKQTYIPINSIQVTEEIDPVSDEQVSVYRFAWIVTDTRHGTVQIVMPLLSSNQEFFLSGRLIIVFAAAYSLLVILFGVMFLKQMILAPVQELNGAVLRLMAGERNFQLPGGEKNELGQLAMSFNQMAEQLYFNEQLQSDQIAELLKVNEELEITRRSLIRTEKLASIGRLAAGVAHEVGNPMSAILGYVGLLQSGGLDKETEKDFLRRIDNDINRINSIIRGLLDYSRKDKEKIELIDLNELIEDTIELVKHQQQFKNNNFDRTSHLNPALVMADANQLQQVLVNLFMNASQAMNQEGPISIFLENLKFDPSVTYRQSSGKFKAGQSLISLAVIDQGEGMSEETESHIFDPFFTTKEIGSGTGLGLSVSDNIIDSFGGTIEVNSQPKEGAVFMILLPETKKEVVETKETELG